MSLVSNPDYGYPNQESEQSETSQHRRVQFCTYSLDTHGVSPQLAGFILRTVTSPQRFGMVGMGDILEWEYVVSNGTPKVVASLVGATLDVCMYL